MKIFAIYSANSAPLCFVRFREKRIFNHGLPGIFLSSVFQVLRLKSEGLKSEGLKSEGLKSEKTKARKGFGLQT
jgi:hypothetical protein